jgi:hypothetical protein
MNNVDKECERPPIEAASHITVSIEFGRAPLAIVRAIVDKVLDEALPLGVADTEDPIQKIIDVGPRATAVDLIQLSVGQPIHSNLLLLIHSDFSSCSAGCDRRTSDGRENALPSCPTLSPREQALGKLDANRIQDSGLVQRIQKQGSFGEAAGSKNAVLAICRPIPVYPTNRHAEGPSACLKRASNGHSVIHV